MDICIKPQLLGGEINAISSKSDVHRLLICAALTNEKASVHFTTLSEDIKATVSVLCDVGFKIEIQKSEYGYTARLFGCDKFNEGALLDANECGTTARLILPTAAALLSSFTLCGSEGLSRRPFSDLCCAMEQNGVALSSHSLPIRADGKMCGGVFELRGDVSSQYISGLLLALPLLCTDSEIVLTTPLVSKGYVDMTLKIAGDFGIEYGKRENGFFIKGNQKYRNLTEKAEYFAEGDWSNSAFWLCGGALGKGITVRGLSCGSLQKDKRIVELLSLLGANVSEEGGKLTVTRGRLMSCDIYGEDIPDLIPVLATVCALADGKSVIGGGGRLKIKESDRISSTAAMLKALGADITARDDGFEIHGVRSFNGGVVNAENDHRIAMCAAIASQMAMGDVIICGAECVAKSYPTFFEDFEKLGGSYSVING